jgi:hypothetical protein
MVRTMLDEHRTHKRFWVDAISSACYILNQIFLRSILNLTPFELCFERKLFASHLRHFGCKCLILKHDNLDKFASRSSDDILVGYAPHSRSYRVFNTETNTVVESYNVTFTEIAPCPRDIFESAGDKEIEESIFVYEKLQDFDGDEDESLHPSTSSPELFPASTLEAEAPRATTSSTVAVEVSRFEEEIISEKGTPSHAQKTHLPQ